jgi:hypothetical protein
MIFSMVTLKDDTIGRLLDNPHLVWKVIAPDDSSVLERTTKEKGSLKGIFSRFFGRNLKVGKPSVSNIDFKLSSEDGEGVSCDIDKSWQALHFMFTGTAWEGDFPENFLIRGGSEIGDIDVGYGPARAITSDKLIAIDALLRSLPTDDFLKRFDSRKMTDEAIYPETWNRTEEETRNKEYIQQHFETLGVFVKKAVSMHLGILVWCG